MQYWATLAFGFSEKRNSDRLRSLLSSREEEDLEVEVNQLGGWGVG